MNKAFIPKHLWLQDLNPAIDVADFDVHVVQEATPWLFGRGNAIAGVSSFGFSGTNAHVVLQNVHKDASLHDMLLCEHAAIYFYTRFSLPSEMLAHSFDLVVLGSQDFYESKLAGNRM